jgi:hypothetical protein
VASIVPFLKRLYLADKAPINAAIVGGLVILGSRAGFHLNASDTGYLAAGVGIVLGLLVQGKQAAVKSAAKPVAPPVAPVVIHAATTPVSLSPAPRTVEGIGGTDAPRIAGQLSPQVVEEVQDTFPHPAS